MPGVGTEPLFGQVLGHKGLQVGREGLDIHHAVALDLDPGGGHGAQGDELRRAVLGDLQPLKVHVDGGLPLAVGPADVHAAFDHVQAMRVAQYLDVGLVGDHAPAPGREVRHQVAANVHHPQLPHRAHPVGKNREVQAVPQRGGVLEGRHEAVARLVLPVGANVHAGAQQLRGRQRRSLPLQRVLRGGQHGHHRHRHGGDHHGHHLVRHAGQRQRQGQHLHVAHAVTAQQHHSAAVAAGHLQLQHRAAQRFFGAFHGGPQACASLVERVASGHQFGQHGGVARPEQASPLGLRARGDGLDVAALVTLPGHAQAVAAVMRQRDIDVVPAQATEHRFAVVLPMDFQLVQRKTAVGRKGIEHHLGEQRQLAQASAAAVHFGQLGEKDQQQLRGGDAQRLAGIGQRLVQQLRITLLRHHVVGRAGGQRVQRHAFEPVAHQLLQRLAGL